MTQYNGFVHKKKLERSNLDPPIRLLRCCQSVNGNSKHGHNAAAAVVGAAAKFWALDGCCRWDHWPFGPPSKSLGSIISGGAIPGSFPPLTPGRSRGWRAPDGGMGKERKKRQLKTLKICYCLLCKAQQELA